MSKFTLTLTIGKEDDPIGWVDIEGTVQAPNSDEPQVDYTKIIFRDKSNNKIDALPFLDTLPGTDGLMVEICGKVLEHARQKKYDHTEE